MRIISVICGMVIGTILTGCGKHDAVRLEIDLGARSQWNYRMHVAINGAIRDSDTLRNFSNSARCMLRGKPAANDRTLLVIGITDVDIASSIMSGIEIENLRRQLEGNVMAFSMSDGTLAPADSNTLPVVRIGEWDLYRTLMRAIPAIPAHRIRPGFGWDREKHFPLESSLGDAVGYLYQSFKLDSIDMAGTPQARACIGWQFSYRIEPLEQRTRELYKGVPLMGNGHGDAVFDIAGKHIRSARVSFSVRRDESLPWKIWWKEDVVLELVE